MSTANDVSIDSANVLLPQCSDVIWNITAADVTSGRTMPAFIWIRAFFDSTLTVVPQLVIDSGKVDTNGVPYQSLMRFAYSGEPQFFKGSRVLATGVDRFGNVITSTPIGTNILTNILEVKCYGGAGGHK